MPDAHGLRVRRIGCTALAATRRSANAHPVRDSGASPYCSIDGEVVWLGCTAVAMHPRAVMLSGPLKPGGRRIRLDLQGARAWHPPARSEACLSVREVAERLAGIRARLVPPAPATGFGGLLLGAKPAFPLALAMPHVRALASAYRDDCAEDAFTASLPLLGLGPGLTPSGDDLVGAALFARRSIAQFDERWESVARALAAESSRCGSTVSAALFSDLAAGQTFEPLHRLAQALSNGAEAADAVVPELLAIGHSSGWDMLAGFMLGAGSGSAAGF